MAVGGGGADPDCSESAGCGSAAALASFCETDFLAFTRRGRLPTEGRAGAVAEAAGHGSAMALASFCEMGCVAVPHDAAATLASFCEMGTAAAMASAGAGALCPGAGAAGCCTAGLGSFWETRAARPVC